MSIEGSSVVSIYGLLEGEGRGGVRWRLIGYGRGEMRQTTTGVRAKKRKKRKKKKNEAALVFFDGVSIYMYMHRLIQSPPLPCHFSLEHPDQEEKNDVLPFSVSVLCVFSK
jgi:hypothetical protein